MSDVRCLKFDLVLRGLKLSMFLLFVVLMSCEEEQPDPPGNPADKQYIGIWSGNTNEGLLVTFQIDTIDQWTRVERFTINYHHNDTSIKSRVNINVAGIAVINGGEFRIDLGGGEYLDGNFSGNNLLSGTINIDDNTRSFSCTMEGKEINLASVCQACYNFRQNTYFFRQDQNDIITRLENHLTYNHRKYFSSSLKLRPPTDDSIRLIKITKGRLSDLWNEDAFVQFFGPGKRNYSIGGRNGVEIILHDTEDNFRRWSTSSDSANQQGSTFEIIETKKLESNLQDKVIVKLIAKFDCMMYDGEGNEEPLSDGVFIGLFEHELEK